jgi:hypothetical protein
MISIFAYLATLLVQVDNSFEEYKILDFYSLFLYLTGTKWTTVLRSIKSFTSMSSIVTFMAVLKSINHWLL